MYITGFKIIVTPLAKYIYRGLAFRPPALLGVVNVVKLVITFILRLKSHVLLCHYYCVLLLYNYLLIIYYLYNYHNCYDCIIKY